MLSMKDIIQECQAIATREKVDPIPIIRINNRLTATWARVLYPTTGPISLEFSPKTLEYATDEELRSIIYHEMAHYIAYKKTGECHGHDRYFKSICERLGGESASTTKLKHYDEAKEAKYKIVCPNCGHASYYTRKPRCAKHLEEYRCGECKKGGLRFEVLS